MVSRIKVKILRKSFTWPCWHDISWLESVWTVRAAGTYKSLAYSRGISHQMMWLLQVRPPCCDTKLIASCRKLSEFCLYLVQTYFPDYMRPYCGFAYIWITSGICDWSKVSIGEIDDWTLNRRQAIAGNDGDHPACNLVVWPGHNVLICFTYNSIRFQTSNYHFG